MSMMNLHTMNHISAPFDHIVRELFSTQQKNRLEKVKDINKDSIILSERFEKYPYIVKMPKITWRDILENENVFEEWCNNNCQQEYVYQWVNGKSIGGDFVIDVTGMEQTTVFAFKNLQDANLFMLRWS